MKQVAELNRELEITLDAAVMLTEGASLRQIAERIYDSERELVSQLERPWVVDRLVWMLQRRQSKLSSGNQLPLPGFERLPRRLTVKDGRRAPLRFATLMQLRQFRAILWKKRDGRIEPLDRLIELVGRYSEETPGITVADVMAREMARLELHR